MTKRLLLWLGIFLGALLAPYAPKALHLVGEVWTKDSEVAAARPNRTFEATNPAAPPTSNRCQVHEQHDTGNGGEPVGTFDVEDHQDELTKAVADVAETHLREALDSTLQDRGAMAEEFREMLVRRWAERDPRAALVWGGGLEDPLIEKSAIRQATVAWANKDMSAAIQWAGGLPDGLERNTAVIALGYEAARTLSFDAFNLAVSLPPSGERDALLVHIVRQWAASDFTEAANWATHVPDAALRDKLVSAAAVSAATKEPEAAASLIARNLSPGHAQDQAAVAIVQRWGQEDPQAVQAWISQFPDGSAKLAASEALAAIRPAPESAVSN